MALKFSTLFDCIPLEQGLRQYRDWRRKLIITFDCIPLEQGLRHHVSGRWAFDVGKFDCIPLEQGLRLLVWILNEWLTTVWLYSIRTRIKTVESSSIGFHLMRLIVFH